MVVQYAIQVAVSLAVFMLFAAIVEIMRRRGFDPIAKIAAMFDPPPPTGNGETA